MANLPRNGQVSNERSMGCRGLRTAAVNAGSAGVRGRLALAIALAACWRFSSLVAGSAGAATTSKTTVVLGNTATMPDPSCPESPCQAIGSVTGFQVSTSQGSLPFRVRKDGKIKSWTLTLSQPTNSQRSFFNSFFGTPPQARLAILRRVPGTNPPRYNLRAQGSIHVLSPYLGQTVSFGASLRGRKDDIVGLTVPTWAPAFAQGLAIDQRLARQPRTRQMRQLHRRPPGRTTAKGRHSRHLRLPLLNGSPALHGHCRRGLASSEKRAGRSSSKALQRGSRRAF